MGAGLTHSMSPRGRAALVAVIALSLVLSACGRGRPPLETTPPGLHAPTLTILEDRSDGANTQLDLEVVLQPARQSEVRVDYRIEDGSAVGGADYTVAQPSGTLVFAPGETRKAIRVVIIDDALYERNAEEFRLVLSNAQGADLAEAVGVITIEDFDRPPFAGISAGVTAVEEVAAGGNASTVIFTVALDIPSGAPAVVEVNTNGDSQATPYVDYLLEDADGNPQRLPLRFTFAPGETEKRFLARIVDDGQAENDEKLVLGVVRQMEGAVFAPSRELAQVTIRDDDRPDYAQVSTAPRRRLNDTGVVRFAYNIGWDDGRNGGTANDGVVDRYVDDHTWKEPYETAPVADAPSILELYFYDGQDALFGADAEARAATGDVNATGFRFTKLDANGVPLADQSADYATTPWHCVRDETTGLVWEVKVPQGTEPAVHGESTPFYWYDVDAQANGGEAGRPGLPDCSQGTCNAGRLVAIANAERWCGRGGWRLPTLEELRSIADYGNDYNRRDEVERSTGYLPAPLNEAFFPNANPTYPYWSTTPLSADPAQVWGMRFRGIPEDVPLSKSQTALVRLVSDGP